MRQRIDTVKMMVFSSEIMRNLMMDLLDLAQMENSSFKLNKEFFSIRDTIKKVFGVVSHIANKKNVRLIKEPVAKDEEKLYNSIYGDESRFV
jgi:signal transduction histidine kinase